MSKVSRASQRMLCLEGLELRKLMAADALQLGLSAQVGDTAQYNDRPDYFIADSFSFGVEREMKESGEKGGTEDMNIGIGELQECTISKSMDAASPTLAQFAINGNSCGAAEVDQVYAQDGGEQGEQATYLNYKLERCFVKSWSTSGDADDRPMEEVAFYFNPIP